MSDILSQNEIDELLKALNDGAIDVQQMTSKTNKKEKKIKTHDFRRPSKFAKDQLKSLQVIHENYSRLLQNFLSGYLRTLVQIELISVEPMAYYEFNNSISNPAVLAIVDFQPLSGNVIFEISPNITFAFIDRILGGKGLALDKMRTFTEVEMVIVERLLIQMLNLLKEPWSNISTLKPKMEKIETNAQFAQIISPNEIIALVTFNIRIGETEGMINFCIPYIVVETVASKLSTKVWYNYGDKEVTEEVKNYLERKVENSRVPLRAILGNTTISVNEFLEMHVGDVLPLDSNADGFIDIMVGNILKFHAKPGVRRSRVAVKITEILKREEE